MLIGRMAEKRINAAIQRLHEEKLSIVLLSPRLLDGWSVTKDAASLSDIWHVREVDGQRYCVGSLAQQSVEPASEGAGQGNE